MNLRFVGALCALLSFSQAGFASDHSDVTPFERIRTRLQIQPGQTYLEFMKRRVKPGLDAYQSTIQSDPASAARNYRQLQVNLIAKGAGVAIRIDPRNYIFNIGYLNGSDPKNDVKSGRSYGVGPAGTESHPSDIAYLTELENYLQTEPNSAGNFIYTLMRVLTNCDTSGWARLSTLGQGVATDFLAIYTAELDRHLMVGLNPSAHPWEIDLAAATFVSVFDAASGLMMKNGALVPGSIQAWWAPGKQGSGIGETRRDRIALQKLISRFEANSAEATAIDRIVGLAVGDDLIQGVLLYLNSPDAAPNMSGQDSVNLSQLMVRFLTNVQLHSRLIANFR